MSLRLNRSAVCASAHIGEGTEAGSRADAHADRSTFVSRKATISGFAANPTRTFFANTLKADRNHGFTFLLPLGSYEIVRANFIL